MMPSLNRIEPTSLQKLQALEQDYNGFEAQLERVAEIAKLSKYLAKRRAVNDTRPGSELLCYGRLDWAIRWVLNKLRASTSVGAQARSSHHAWNLLAELLTLLHPSVAARALSSSRFLSLIEEALSETFSEGQHTIDSAAGPEGEGTDVGAKNGESPDSAAAVASPATKGPKKRKRIPETELSITSKKRRLVENENGLTPSTTGAPSHARLQLFLAIAKCLTTVVSICRRKSDAQEPFSVEYMRSVLRVDAAQAAKLLGRWLVALTWLTKNDTRDHNTNRVEEAFNSYSLSHVSYIWDCRSTAAGEIPIDDIRHFSIGCLVPAVCFLQLAKQSTAPQFGAASKDNIDQVERLLAQYLLMPAKAEFHQARRRGEKDVKAVPAVNDKFSLSALFKPLHTWLLRDEQLHENRRGARHGAKVIPIMFDIAIRCTPLPTPRRRLTEAPWLQAVFSALAACSGFDFTYETVEAYESSNIDYFEPLLGLARKNQLSLGRELLDSITKRVSGLASLKNDKADWSIIAHLVALDAEIFLGNRSGTENDRDAQPRALGDLLLSAITTGAWTRTGPDVSRLKQDYSLNSTSQAYSLIKNDIVIPLLNAYASARDLKGFLIRWRAQLVQALQQSLKKSSQADDSQTQMHQSSVWEDDDLTQILSQLLRTSITTRQVAEIFELFTADFEEAPDQAIDGAQVRIAASASLLRSLLAGVNNGEIDVDIQSKARDLSLNCVALLESKHHLEKVVRSRLWRLITLSSRTWLSTNSVEREEVRLRSLVEKIRNLVSVNLKSANSSEQWPTCEETLASLACLGSIASELTGRHLYLTESIALLDSDCEILSDIVKDTAGPLQSFKAYCFASVVATYPTLTFLSKPEKEPLGPSQDLLHATASLALEGESTEAVTSTFSEAMLPWQSLLHHAVGEYISLAPSILKTLSSLRAAERSQPVLDERKEVTRLIENSYLALPPSIMARRKREEILDHLVDQLGQGPRIAYMNSSDWMRMLALILKELELPANSARIVSDPQELWKITTLLDTDIFADQIMPRKAASVLAVFREVVESIKRHHISTRDNTLSQRYWQILLRMTNEEIHSDYLERSPAKIAVCMASCTIAPLITDFDGSGRLAILNKFCSKLCAILMKLASLYISQGNSVLLALQLSSVLEAICNLDIDTFTSNKTAVQNAITSWSQIELHREPTAFEDDLPVASLTFKIKNRLTMLEGGVPNLADATAVLRRRPLACERRVIRSALVDSVQSLDSEGKAGILRELLPAAGNRHETTEKLRLLHMLVSASTTKIHNHLLPLASIPTVVISLATHLPLSHDIVTFTLTADTLTNLLHRHSKPINQLAVESVLLAITTTCSPSGPPLPPASAPYIFPRLARLLHLLLTHHRRTLRGRSDLLVLALQPLLRCLFLRTPSTHPTALLHPPWAPIHPGSALTAPHATAYARLLTTLCDPTVASVRGATSHTGLTDETRKARGYAAQYVPLVLVELCRCLLEGRLGPGVREALVPGVWSAFEVVGRDVLEAGTAGMGAAARSVLRGLREEWRRAGKGGGG